MLFIVAPWLDMAYCNIEKFVWNLMSIASPKADGIWQDSPSLVLRPSLLPESTERQGVGSAQGQ